VGVGVGVHRQSPGGRVGSARGERRRRGNGSGKIGALGACFPSVRTQRTLTRVIRESAGTGFT
jgi:hypothetical protein